MKFISLLLLSSFISFGAIAEGESNATTEIDCCKTGKCGNGLPQCPLQRVAERREFIPAKKRFNSSGKSSGATGE